MDLSEKEKASLEQFKTLIADVKHKEHGDRDFVKWLKVKKWNPKKAGEMYIKSMQWRKQMGADSIVSTYTEPEVLSKYFSGGQSGRDVDGCPIIVDPSGWNDVIGIQRSAKKEDIAKTVIKRIEDSLQKMKKWNEENHGQAGQTIQIMDMAGFVSNKMDMSVMHFYLDIMKIIDNNYPDLVKKSYIINAPSMFNTAWKFMKRFLSKATTDKFFIFEGDGKEQIQLDLPANQVPAYYGGSLVDASGDPMCKEWIVYGGPVPTSYYKTLENCLPSTGSVTTLIGRGEVLKVEVHFETVPSLIRWVFATDDKAIKFGVYREKQSGKNSLEDMDPVLPLTLVESHVFPEESSAFCEESGKYFLVFDNSAHKLTRRKLIYHFDVEAAE